LESRTYKVGRSTITLRFGDISKSAAEVVVSSDDCMLSMGGGVSAALLRVAGPHLAADASKLVPAELGDVVVSSAGDLPARYVFHAITIAPGRRVIEPAVIVRRTTRRAVHLLQELGCSWIAFPAIGAGVAGIPYETVAAEMASVLIDAVIESELAHRIDVYLLDRFQQMRPEDFFVFFEEFAARNQGLSVDATARARVLSVPTTSTGGMSEEDAAQAKRRHDIYTMLRKLEASRNAIETKLVFALGHAESMNPGELEELRKQREVVEGLRRDYQAELASADGGEPTVPRSVFVSSTREDLLPHRKAVRAVVQELRLEYVGMEEFSPQATPPADLIRRKVTESAAFVGILGMRYGYVYPGTSLSMTEMEYHQAKASRKPLHMFVMAPHAPITAEMVETNAEHFAKLIEFKRRVMVDETCSLFTTPEDLADQTRKTLGKMSAGA
jgi:O-acetyl-ADP-ribose deacetylase (regulator of RNase III)